MPTHWMALPNTKDYPRSYPSGRRLRCAGSLPMDLFPDAEMIRDIQKELDALIEAGIVRLTTLLLNSDSGGETDSFELQTQKQNFYRDYKGTGKRSASKGKLTERLIAEGLLTPQILCELQYEWIKSAKKKKKHNCVVAKY